ncbi:universal stress protein [Tomitella biformata]|uniref:universal stress protein n=1 Tax=Tomitella biformata TaxID=630403 RepID=UPI000464E255|nr:universal stress protein [Tomitella biformata]
MPNLVVGYDRHPASRSALAFAADLAGRLDAGLHVVHVVDDEDVPVDPDSDDLEAATAGRAEWARAAADAQLAEFAGAWTYYSRHGRPAVVLAQIATDTDAAMIVLGVPRKGLMAMMERLLGESVSAAEVRLAGRPVVLVPEQAGDTD